jgi:hypothetical protein
MIGLRSLSLLVFAPLAAACATATAAPTLTAASIDPALTRDKAAAALASTPESGKDCRLIAITAAPIAVQHLDSPNLQQTLGHTRLAQFSNASAGERVFEGTTLATIIGKQPTGEMIGNHHVLFAEGGLRTRNDIITVTPTKDKCIVTAKAKVNFYDGTGEFAGYSGAGVADATLNFCGAAGHAVVYGKICKADAQ